jgi:cytochrome P450
VHARIEGRRITEEEIIGCMFFLWVGGLDTVAATTALMFRRLALDTGLQDQLRKDPAIIPSAIDEFLRVQPLINSSRLVKQDHEIHGVKIRAGEHVMCYNLAGNFDPEEFESPREVRFDRQTNRHFSLGGGPHRCLGSHVARRELTIALGEFLRRMPPFTLRPDADRTVYPNLKASLSVPIVWAAAG